MKAPSRSWIVVLILTTACAPGLTSRELTPGPEAAGSAIYLNVVNRYNSPMEVYAVGGGVTYRMGTVLPGLSSRFLLRPGMSHGPVEFLAKANNSDQPIRSGRLLLAPGKVVEFDIATHPLNSAATVRP